MYVQFWSTRQSHADLYYEFVCIDADTVFKLCKWRIFSTCVTMSVGNWPWTITHYNADRMLTRTLLFIMVQEARCSTPENNAWHHTSHQYAFVLNFKWYRQTICRRKLEWGLIQFVTSKWASLRFRRIRILWNSIWHYIDGETKRMKIAVIIHRMVVSEQ